MSVRDQITLDVKEAAALLGCSRSTIKRLIAAGQLPVVKFCNRLMIRTEAIENFLDAHTEVRQPKDKAA